MSDVWVQRATEAYEISTSFVDTNYRSKWEEDLSHFNSDHAQGSKYHSSHFKHRSKVFRPKTRSSLRSNEAAAVAAFFSNQDAVSIEAGNTSNKLQRMSAEIWQEVLNYRLTKTIPWFQTVIGGFQDAQTIGVVCSRQEWLFKEKTEKYEEPIMFNGQPVIGDDGEPITQEIEEDVTVKDEPCIKLIPVENLRIDPGADWRDPINDSPYVIELMPMYVKDVKARMKEPGVHGEPKWKKLDDKDLHDGLNNSDDSTREARNDTTDRHDEDYKELSDFDKVWVHRNIMSIDGQDMLFYTLSTSHLLSDPVPLEENSKIGRNYVLGCCVIETHHPYPGGVARLGSQVQKEINEIANQRLDNVKMVLNKRWVVRRGGEIDVNSLMRNVPGGVTYANNPDADIRELNWPDVTGSSYQEQDRLNVDYDEVTGTFSTGSVNTNRKLGETVGGMSMLRGASNIQTEYLLRVFAETWVEPVLRQLLKLEQAYETDLTILNYAAEKAQILPRYGQNYVTDEILNQELNVVVNVGMGATDPVTRLERFIMAMSQFMQILQGAAQLQQMGMPIPDLEEVKKEIFGRLGYKDGDRFFQMEQGQNPQIQQMQQTIQQLQQALQSKEQERQDKLLIEHAKLEDADLDRELKARVEAAKLRQDGVDRQADMIKQRMTEANKFDIAQLDSFTKLANQVPGETSGR